MTTFSMRMDAAELGENLARLVWESFSDMLGSPATPQPAWQHWRKQDGRPPLVPEEVLILFLWVHTRVCQNAFQGRADAERLRDVLDAMHRAVFEDLEAHGVPARELPIFEQRVAARYSEYYGAANKGGERTVGEVAASYVLGSREPDAAFYATLAEATTAAAGPLRDFLDDVELSADRT